MKNKYKNPQLVILLFDETDVITASSPWLNDAGENGGANESDALDWGDIF